MIFGIELSAVNDLNAKLSEVSSSESVNFISVPLFHPKQQYQNVTGTEIPLTRSDLVLESKDWISNIVGICNENVDFDSPEPSLRDIAEYSLLREYSLSCHLGLQALILPSPSLLSPNYARIVKQMCLNGNQFQHLWLKIPLVAPITYKDKNNNNKNNNIADGWKLWDNFRYLIGHHRKVSVAIEFGPDLPENIDTIYRWLSEPVGAIIISTSLFLENAKGYPVLPKRYQVFLNPFLKQTKIHILFCGRSRHGSKLFEPYKQYIQYLQNNIQESMTEADRFIFHYQDTLQNPLQPLMDNLESQTYETFEKDPIKYEKYEEAIYQALCYKKQKTNDCIVVTVVGAGRGPLISATLRASSRAVVQVKVFGVEKNENAIITLRNRIANEKEWNGIVQIISSDMRNWKSNENEKADILVSELLGSWGDNELSPECLDGAEMHLKQDGISIPKQYTSFIMPISASKLWMHARDIPDGKGLETPYVVNMQSCFAYDSPKKLFTFQHPQFKSESEIKDGKANRRYEVITFVSKFDGTLHGLQGTFESILYGDVMISINPHSFSTGMFSWFPLFIPFSVPIKVKKGEEIVVCIWRHDSSQKVWYEWCLMSPIHTSIQNTNGKSYWIGR